MVDPLPGLRRDYASNAGPELSEPRCDVGLSVQGPGSADPFFVMNSFT